MELGMGLLGFFFFFLSSHSDWRIDAFLLLLRIGESVDDIQTPGTLDAVMAEALG